MAHLVPWFYVLQGWWEEEGASEFHTFANIQILNGRARLERMSACLFDVPGFFQEFFYRKCTFEYF